MSRQSVVANVCGSTAHALTPAQAHRPMQTPTWPSYATEGCNAQIKPAAGDLANLGSLKRHFDNSILAPGHPEAAM